MTDRIVHIVDDEASIRKSLSFLLKTTGHGVHAHDSGTAFLKSVDAAEPGCILLDIRMPEIDGLTVQRRLAERGIGWPVIVLTGHGDVATAVRAMKAGATDFLEKPFEDTALFAALDRGFQRLANRDAQQADAQTAKTRLAILTPREQDVLTGLVRGHPNKTIAYDLGISPRTVEIHRANLMAKLDVRSLSDALRLAFAAGVDGG